MQIPKWEYPAMEELLWQCLWIISVYRLTSYSVGDHNTHDQLKQPHIKWEILASPRTFPLLFCRKQGKIEAKKELWEPAPPGLLSRRSCFYTSLCPRLCLMQTFPLNKLNKQKYRVLVSWNLVASSANKPKCVLLTLEKGWTSKRYHKAHLL